MGERTDELEAQVRELRMQMDLLLEKQRGQNESGAPRQPIQVLYLVDPSTKAVAKVTYDSASSALSTEEV